MSSLPLYIDPTNPQVKLALTKLWLHVVYHGVHTYNSIKQHHTAPGQHYTALGQHYIAPGQHHTQG
jgi:hypothetical protein